jgi:putative YhbY family RNA-binding protein
MDKMNATMSSVERRALKARAHALKPVVTVSGAGLTESVLAEIDRCLAHHELIKIRVFGDDRAARETLLESVCAGTGAQAVQHIGKILVVHRAKPPERPAPAARGARATGKAKRSLAKRPVRKRRPDWLAGSSPADSRRIGTTKRAPPRPAKRASRMR